MGKQPILAGLFSLAPILDAASYHMSRTRTCRRGEHHSSQGRHHGGKVCQVGVAKQQRFLTLVLSRLLQTNTGINSCYPSKPIKVNFKV